MNVIQNGDILYRYVAPEVFPEGQTDIPISIFNDKELSCDWNRYQLCPESSPHVENGRTRVISIRVCDAIRNPVNPKRTGELVPDWAQEFIYDPLEHDVNNEFTPNLSHSLIRGKKKLAVTTAIRDNSTVKDLVYVAPIVDISSLNQQDNSKLIPRDVVVSK